MSSYFVYDPWREKLRVVSFSKHNHAAAFVKSIELLLPMYLNE